MGIAPPATFAALLVLVAAGCGGDRRESSTKTVTVTATAPAATVPSQPPESSASTGAAKPAGPPLPAGVVGIDGRYLLKTVKDDYDGPDIGVQRFYAYEEPSNAATTCVNDRCSVKFRLGLKSGGSKPYTLKADPARQRTYVGTSTGQIDCPPGTGGRHIPSRERIAVRTGSVTKISGRQVAGRLTAYVTITARCDEPAKYVATLRGPRQP
jgi:hypothetical protein